jgi:hypothetical protein
MIVVKAREERPVMHLLDACIDILRGEKDLEIEIKKRWD